MGKEADEAERLTELNQQEEASKDEISKAMGR